LTQHEDNRTEGRSNVFLAARLEAGKASVPVRIRNISSHGALVDGSDIPPVGATIRLSRGSLVAFGEVAWREKQNAGVTFQHPVDVEQWVQRTGHAGQERVDQVVNALRRSESVPQSTDSLKDEDALGLISAELDRICERFANTRNMSVEFGEELLRLDVIAQTLRQLAGR
jgi:hypothetical protein